MKKKRKKYTREFREETVKLITEQGYQIAETARNTGINETMPGRWKREITGGEDNLSPDGTRSMREELSRLGKENKRLKQP